MCEVLNGMCWLVRVGRRGGCCYMTCLLGTQRTNRATAGSRPGCLRPLCGSCTRYHGWPRSATRRPQRSSWIATPHVQGDGVSRSAFGPGIAPGYRLVNPPRIPDAPIIRLAHEPAGSGDGPRRCTPCRLLQPHRTEGGEMLDPAGFPVVPRTAPPCWQAPDRCSMIV
jgi:hypothetical protein